MINWGTFGRVHQVTDMVEEDRCQGRAMLSSMNFYSKKTGKHLAVKVSRDLGTTYNEVSALEAIQNYLRSLKSRSEHPDRRLIQLEERIPCVYGQGLLKFDEYCFGDKKSTKEKKSSNFNELKTQKPETDFSFTASSDNIT